MRDPDGQFERNYNRCSFSFAHELCANPLFELQHLIDYSRRLPDDPALAYWSNGAVGVADGWDSRGRPRLTLADTLTGIADDNSLVLLKRIERDDTFGPVLRDLMERLTSLAGAAMRDDVIIGRGTLLIASPGRITSYHIDSDTNFLFQIAGDKTIRVFDQTDRTLLTDVELECYYAGDMNGAAFKPAREHDGKTYDLKPGLGVHIPCMAPHWAQNRDHVSIALSVNFDLRTVERLGRIYKLNHRLRRYGLNPTPPGVSAWRDRVKLASVKGLTATRGLLRR